MDHNRQKKIAVINDFSGFGRCSIAVALPLISAMKLQCCPLPTAIFSNHTGFPDYVWHDCTDEMEPYAQCWRKLGLRFDGIATGFLGSRKQLDIVARFLQEFKTTGTTVLVDPVMGDYGKLYATYSPELAAGMHQLVRYADILTPNLTEACILTGTPYRDTIPPEQLEDICRALSADGPSRVVISGLDFGNQLGNFVYQDGQSELITTEKVGSCRSGTGDVFASLLIGDAVNGKPFADSVRHTAQFIGKTIRRTVELAIPTTDGICFEEFMSELAPNRESE